MEEQGIFHIKICEIENILWAPRVIELFLEHLRLEPCSEDDFSAFFFKKLRQQKEEFANAVQISILPFGSFSLSSYTYNQETQDQAESRAAGHSVDRNVKCATVHTKCA